MKFTYSLDDMRLFWVVSQKGSFKKAAEHLEMPTSTLSRRISQLEDSLQLRLLNRDAHRVTLTGTGRQYLSRCCPLFEELETVATELHEEKHEACGTIRITAPVQFSHHRLGQIFNEFLQLYPKVKIDLKLSDHNLDIVDEYIDLAFRAGDSSTSEWIARPMEEVQAILCASSSRPEWHDIECIDDLDQFPLIVSSPINVWNLLDTATNKVNVYEPGNNVKLMVDDVYSAKKAMMDGLGVAFLPCFMVKDKIEEGELTLISQRFTGAPRRLYMMYRDRDNQPYRLRLLIDFMLNHPCFKASW